MFMKRGPERVKSFFGYQLSVKNNLQDTFLICLEKSYLHSYPITYTFTMS